MVASSRPMAAIGGYELLESLATGEQGSLHRARTRGGAGFRRGVLVREMRISRESATALAASARAASSLVHPNLVLTWELGEHGGAWFLASELVEGRSLRKIVDAAASLPAPAAWRIVVELARGLDALHARGIFHGDVSQRTVLVTGSGEVKLRDAALPHLAAPASRYRAPEQTAGAGDARSDVFALATIAREILGKGEARLEEVLSRASSPQAEDRPANAAALLAALQPWTWSLTGNAGAPELAAAVKPLLRAPISSFPDRAPEDELPGTAAVDSTRDGTQVSAGVPDGTRGGTQVSAGVPEGTRGGTQISAPNPDATEIRPRTGPVADRSSKAIGPIKPEAGAGAGSDLDELPGVRAMPAGRKPELPGGGLTKGAAGLDSTAMSGGLSRVGTGIVAIPESIRQTPPAAMFVLVAFGVLAGVFGVLAASVGPAPARETPTPTPTAITDPKLAGVLTVLSRPPGAQVLLDGKKRSTTPTEIPELEVGRSYRVDVAKPGFKTWTLDVKIQGSAPIELNAVLEPEAPK